MIAPKLALNFVAAVLDPRITFTRTGATATRVNASGLIESVAANTARFDFDPTTLVCKGLLIEEQRQNVIFNSGNWSAASWVPAPTGGATINVTGNSGTAPDGTNTATKIDFNATSGNEAFIASNNFSVTVNQIFTGSFYAKATSVADVGKQLLFRHVGSAGYTVVTLTANWVRYSSTETSPATYTPTMQIGLRPVVGGSSGAVSALFWGGQMEQGAFPTSYIPTTTTAVTRSADDALITGTAFSGFWRSGPGSLLVRALPSTVSGTRPLVQMDDATVDNIIALRGNTTNPELYIRAGGADQATIDAGTISAAAYRLAGAWQAGSAAASLNSGLAVNGAPASIPAVTQMRLGSDGTNYLNGHLQAVEYWPLRLSNASLQNASSTAGYQSIIHPVSRDTIITEPV